MSRKSVFSRIYSRDIWRGIETRSGAGSTMVATQTLREALPQLVHGLGITSLLDAGCGDAHWIPDLEGVEYIGVDLVGAAIRRATAKHPDRTFLLRDIVSDPLPRVDAILCRDVLQHLERVDVLSALENFTDSGADWLLATTFSDGDNDSKGATGGYQEWNLCEEPFGLGAPHMSITYTGWWREDGELVPVAEAVLGAWKMVG